MLDSSNTGQALIDTLGGAVLEYTSFLEIRTYKIRS